MEKAGDGAGALLHPSCDFRPYFWLFTVVFMTGCYLFAGVAFLEFVASVVVAVGRSQYDAPAWPG